MKYDRVPTRPGEPGNMRVHLENMEKTWNFEKFNGCHGIWYETYKNWVTTKHSPLTPRFEGPSIQFKIIFQKKNPAGI